MNQDRKTFWRATATPLASIFGSGFLIIIPILAAATGAASVFAMAGITAVAYAIGEVIRFNIANAEPVFKNNTAKKLTLGFERFSDAALVLAYIISISLYLRILSSFLLGAMDADTEFNEQLNTTVVIGFITILGVVKGFETVEKLEYLALGITLIIIFFVILDFGIYDVSVATGKGIQWPGIPEISNWKLVTILAGTLIVVQGFETSRYLDQSFSAEVRIKSSRMSQIISTVVYLVFIALATPLMHYLSTPIQDNDLIMLSGKVIFFLPAMVIAAAVLSQFSAAVADTVAGAGNMFEVSRNKIGPRTAYIVIGVSAILLTWNASILGLVSLASRGFAFYYMLQCFVALTVCRSHTQRILIGLVAAILAFVTLFAVPAS